MIDRRAALTLAMAALASSAPAMAAEPVSVGYLELRQDARYEPIMAHGRMVLRQRARPFAGAALAFADAGSAARRPAAELKLERMTIESAEDLPAAIRAARDRGVRHFMADLPQAAYGALGDATKSADALVYNVSAPENALRGKECAPSLVHTAPSDSMATDALAQLLAARKWRNALVLQGPSPRDALAAASFEKSLAKFGGKLVARKSFVLGGDPRERERNDIALLTSGADYDVVYVADESLEFARDLPYRTIRPRPVIGAVGLEALAWHWTWDRFGGPQVTSRFARANQGRRMESNDWAAWMAGRMIADAVTRHPEDFSLQRNHILQQGQFDGSKGAAVSVRPWDNQLRQPMLLATEISVVATAPVQGFLHATDTLDTLGDDRHDSACRLKG